MEIIKENYSKYMEVFLAQNAKLNLISKNDEKFLWEKHVFDSLAIDIYFKKHYKCPNDNQSISLLDIGTGGGFPSVPVAFSYPNIEVYALDSIRKKVNAIAEIKEELGLENLHPVCDRAENLKQKFDIITTRAVAPLAVIAGYAAPLLKKGGCFIAYKSRRAEEEIAEAGKVLKKYNLKIVDMIEYELPLEENHTRNLIVIK